MTPLKYYTIYKTTHVDTGRFYIGKHVTSNLDDNYLGSGIYLNKSIRKNGRDRFHKKYLFIYDNGEEMIAKEIELVTEEFCLREDTFNLCLGGKSGGYFASTTEQRKEWSLKGSQAAANKRRGQKDPEHIRRKRAESVSKATRGVPKPWLNKRYIINGKLCNSKKEALEEAKVSLPTMLSRIKSDKWDWSYATQ